MIKEAFYKDRPAFAVACDEFSALFLPLDGAKLVSIKAKNGDELLEQATGETYRRLGLDSSYIKSECSAFDDMFPAIDPCVINGMEYLDHGEVCRREHQVEINGDKITFRCELENLNITYCKTAFAKDGMLHIAYRIENHNEFDFPYVWAGHMMFAGENGAYAVSDFVPESPKRVMFGKPESDRTAHMLPPRGNKQYKFYYLEEKPPVKCGIVYPERKKKISVIFDNSVVKYLGIWMNPGDLNGMYNIALEPCTALYDNPVNAESANAASYIGAGEICEFTLKIGYEEL